MFTTCRSGSLKRRANTTQEQTGGCFRGSALARLALLENLVSAVPRRTSCRLLLSVKPLGRRIHIRKDAHVQPSYWLDLFTGKTWEEFRVAGSAVSGFRESRWTTVQKIRVDDILLCYLTGVSRFVGALRVIAPPFQDATPIWKDETFASRLRVDPIVQLDPEYGVPVHSLLDRLSFFQGLSSPNAWTGRFRGSPTKWPESDGALVLSLLQEAKVTPTFRAVDKKKLAYRPATVKAAIGSVTIPEEDRANEPALEPEIEAPTAHTEIQATLLRLGAEMGFDVWVARNDRSRTYRGKVFADLPRMLGSLPVQFDEATKRTIELIDVLWLRGKAIIAAFEVESTTSIYSGLLRMSDLVSMQPNLNIPLYLVAPDERREKVLAEVNRPTFARLQPPLAEICRYIAFASLREQLQRVEHVLQYLKPEFLEELSESCELEEA